MIDHLLWAVPHLEDGCRQMKTWTGVEPALGGRHPGVGTHNALLSLGPGTYLELIAPDPTQDGFTGLGSLLENLVTPTLITWCAGSRDLDSLTSTAQAAGLTQGVPISMSRRRPDGVELRWRILMVENHPFGPLVPFFIQWDSNSQWDSASHPSRSTPEGCTLKHLQLGHPEPQPLTECLKVLGLELEVVQAPKPGLTATIATPKGYFVLPPKI